MIINTVIAITLTLVSGYADSRGFLYASDIWNNGQLQLDKLVKSGVGFAIGIFCYWIVLRYLKELNVALSTEVQTLGWFSVTMLGIAITSGEIWKWPVFDRFVALFVLLGMGWLLFRGR
jgi:hypothetical protein